MMNEIGCGANGNGTNGAWCNAIAGWWLANLANLIALTAACPPAAFNLCVFLAISKGAATAAAAAACACALAFGGRERESVKFREEKSGKLKDKKNG